MKLILKSSFFRAISSVLAGTLISQLIPIVGTLLLARIYNPEAFGGFAVWLGIALFVAVLLTLRLETSLPLFADGESRDAAVFMVMMTIVVNAIVLLVLGGPIYWFYLQELVDYKNLYFILLIVAAALTAASQTMQSWAAADGRYRDLVMFRIFQSAFILLGQFLCSMLTVEATGMAAGYCAGLIISVFLSLLIKPVGYVRLDKKIKNRLYSFWKSNSRFPKYSLPADAISAGTAQLPALIIAARFGAEQAGLLAMAMRMLGAPMSILSSAVLDVFKRYAAQAYQLRKECKSEYLKAFKMLLLIACLGSLAIFFAAEHAFVLFFGEEWLGAGIIAIWLLPRFAIGFMASPLSYMVYIAGKQHVDLFWQIGLLIMSLATLVVGGTLETALLSYAVGYGLFYMVYLYMSYTYSRGA